MSDLELCPGQVYPIGATWDSSGVNFALSAKKGEAVGLCLFEEPHDN